MSYSALGAIRNLENAVFYRDARGRNASLPNNNSIRIDLLAGRINELAKIVEEYIGPGGAGHLQKLTSYLENTNIENFPDPNKMYPYVDPDTGEEYIDIIKKKDDDKNKYRDVQETLQTIYDLLADAVATFTGITLDEINDPYLIEGINPVTGEENTPESRSIYRTDMGNIPEVFPYLYNLVLYWYKTNGKNIKEYSNVFEGMDHNKNV